MPARQIPAIRGWLFWQMHASQARNLCGNHRSQIALAVYPAVVRTAGDVSGRSVGVLHEWRLGPNTVSAAIGLTVHAKGVQSSVFEHMKRVRRFKTSLGGPTFVDCQRRQHTGCSKASISAGWSVWQSCFTDGSAAEVRLRSRAIRTSDRMGDGCI